ncbi:hypothetical protein [uncultured Pontibacter sp.]|uniref:hypothetical protein n=1 Tax=uncultured Pontibacter sp. TaxID=453356 RepID=UPI00261E9F72|nr:hypothetical protein [uncultured Pontibacter sp.]
MENVIINPEDYTSKYIAYLNKCFKNWGQKDVYDWVFKRTVGGLDSDIILIKDNEGEIIAGSGVTYRKLNTEQAGLIDIAIMTGSWTLPKARGKGCFTTMIEVSKEVAANKGVAFLTAFVTESNASFRRLERAGSYLVSTYHLFSPDEQYNAPNLLNVEEVSLDEFTIDKVYNRLNSFKVLAHFAYTRHEFKEQYIDRPISPIILKINTEYVLIEETHNVMKVLLLTSPDDQSQLIGIVKSLTNWSLRNYAKKLLLFTTDTNIKGVCEELKFENLPGHFTVLNTTAIGTDILKPFLGLAINSGDKI